MPFPLYIAARYLFSKKSQNAINIISLVSVCSVAVGTMALVCVMSVFNGFENVVASMFGNFDPQLKISTVEGKVFDPAETDTVKTFEEVVYYDAVLQENALLQFRDKQTPVSVKGVGENYADINRIGDIMTDGEFMLRSGSFNMAVGGAALVRNMGCGVHFVDPMYLYAPKREGKVNIIRPDQSFRRETVFYSGSFLVQQEQYDNNLLIVSLPVARRLFDYDTEASSIEIKLRDGCDEKKVQKKMQAALGDGFKVQNRYEQQEDFYKMMQVEKWVTYLILSFILVIALFNIVGSLTMLMLDKKEDSRILEDLGACKNDIFRIFLYCGCLITVTGVIAGIVVGLILCYIQQRFGIITLASNYIVSYYPVDVRGGDLVVIAATVCLLGFAASVYPALEAKKQSSTK